MNNNQSLSIYLHIPFCQHRCSYCDFNTYTGLLDILDEYIMAMSNEIAIVAGDQRRLVHTIFFGGGTPSLLNRDQLVLVLDTIHSHFDVAPKAEISLEANPETLTPESLCMLRDAGVNRLSLGVQSANQDELKLLDRTHSFKKVIDGIRMTREAGFNNLNLDLIYGLPEQDLDSWQKSLESCLDAQPEHLSLYCLTIEQGTPLYSQVKAGQVPLPDPDIAADQYELASEMLSEANFEQYEISNWSLPGYECAHNLTYWRNKEYLGFGAGAHGHAAKYRYEVVRQPRDYIRKIRENTESRYPWSPAVFHWQRSSNRDAMIDTIITQLRLVEEGLDLENFAHVFGLQLWDAFPGRAEPLIENGLLSVRDQRLLLTKRGRFLSNHIFRQFI